MSSYSIVRLAALHSLDAVSVLEAQFPGFKSKSFQEQCDCLFQSRVLYSDSFSRALRSLGQDASEIVWDFESLQKQWAVENNVETISSDWMLDILMAQIADRKPDVVYFQGTELAIPGRFSGVDTKDNLPTLLKRKFPFIKLVVMYSGFPSQRSRLKDVDLLFSSPPFVRDHYKNMGMNTVLCYHAFDREVLEKLEEKKRPHRFTFVGSTRPPESRYWTLRRLLEVTEIQLWIDEPDDVHQSSHFSRMALDSITSKMRYLTKTGLGVIEQEYVNKLLINRDLPFVKMIKNTLSNRRRRIEDKPRLQRKINRTLPALTLREMYPSRCYPPVIGLDYYSTLSNSRLTFNKHTDFVYNSVGNMRMFEATGVGACLITDTGCNMPDLFEPDKEVVTYANIEEAVEKSQYLLEHDQEREEIAAAGQERTLRDHTIQNRCELINDEIIKRLEKQNSH